MAMKKTVQGKKRRVRIDDALVEYDDATRVVGPLPRSLMDIWTAKRGKDDDCMNFQCIVKNHKKFPHKVLAVSVIKSRVYVMDKVDHAIRYMIREKDSRGIAVHDKLGIGQPGDLWIYPPAGTKRAGMTHASQRKPHSSARDKTLKKGLVKGQRARIAAVVEALAKS